MGDRLILTVECPHCDYVDEDVYYAPSCGFVEWECPHCGCVVDLDENTTAEVIGGVDSGKAT